jgi:hypothetical protein
MTKGCKQRQPIGTRVSCSKITAVIGIGIIGLAGRLVTRGVYRHKFQIGFVLPRPDGAKAWLALVALSAELYARGCHQVTRTTSASWR